MQFNILINQVRAVEWGLNTQQALVFSFVFNVPTWANSVDVGGESFFHVSKTKVARELPLISDKPNTIFKILKSLDEKGLIKLTSDSRRTLLKITDKGLLWNQDYRLTDAEIDAYHARKKAYPSKKRKEDYRTKVFERDGYVCQACGKQTEPSMIGKLSVDSPEIDHKTPRHRGGTDDIENLQCLCGFCNRSKSDMTMEEFKDHIGKISKVGKKPTEEWKKIKGEGGKNSNVTVEKFPTDQLISNQCTKDQVTSNQNEQSECADDAFQRYWDAGMRKIDKLRARKAFDRKCKQLKMQPAELADLLVADVKKRIQRKVFGFDRLHPATYLNNERWNDEIPIFSPDGKYVGSSGEETEDFTENEDGSYAL